MTQNISIFIFLLLFSIISNGQTPSKNTSIVGNTDSQDFTILKSNKASGFPEEKRLAFVIGIASYKYLNPLPNDLNDAEDMTRIFLDAGFDVLKLIDPDKQRIESAVGYLRSYFAYHHYNVGAFYFSGHGNMYAGINFLMPGEAKSPARLKLDSGNILDSAVHNGVLLADILWAFDQPQLKHCISFIDACRSYDYNIVLKNSITASPLFTELLTKNIERTEMRSRGGVIMATGVGTSASPQSPNTRNSLFTYFLLQTLKERPDIPFTGIYETVTQKMSDQSQKPNIHGGANSFRFYKAKSDIIIPKPVIKNPTYESVESFKFNRARVKKNGLYGYINRDSFEVVPLQFEEARSFLNYKASVKKNNLWGMIDTNGNKVYDFQFTDIPFISYEVAIGTDQSGSDYILDKMGSKNLIIHKYDYYSGIGFNRIRVHKKGLKGFIDMNGKEVIPPIYQDGDNFSHALANVKKGNLWGYIDTMGRVKIHFQFQSATPFNSGEAIVKKNDGIMFINTSGKTILDLGKKYESVSIFNPNNMAKVKKGGLYGFINKKGEEVISPQFNNTYQYFSYGLVPVLKDKLWGYIDTTGKLIINYQFQEAFSFSNERAKVKKNNKYYYINTKGECISGCR